MLEKIYVITDLGPGDGGKGGVVHALSRKIDPSVIIKRGGAQGSHGVCTSFGEKFNFSQWGCGTFDGIPTYCSEQMIISPVGLDNEACALKRTGFCDPYMLLSVDPSCICATPFHMISSQLEELLLGKNPRGTVGTGVGRAYRMYCEFKDEMTIRASELTDRDIIRLKLRRQLEYYRERYAKISTKNVLPKDANLMSQNLDLLQDNGFLPYIVDLFEGVGKKVSLKNLEEVLKYNGSAVIESSHGVLTDAETGLKPHVSAIRTLPEFSSKMLQNAGYNGVIVNLAVHRAYEIRHGAGPIPTHDPEFTKCMVPNSHKDVNRWQGAVRAGPLDLNLLKYAILASKKTRFDGLCLTWFDQILKTDRIWKICTDYKNSQKEGESYTNFLRHATPIIAEHEIPNHITKKELFDRVGEILNPYIKIPLAILSVGATEKEKIFK